jgi:hypothetical protein
MHRNYIWNGKYKAKDPDKYCPLVTQVQQAAEETSESSANYLDSLTHQFSRGMNHLLPHNDEHEQQGDGEGAGSSIKIQLTRRYDVNRPADLDLY